MPIQRYTHYDHTGNDDTHAEPDNQGSWCRTEDVAALEAEVEALKASLAALREAARPFMVARDWLEYWGLLEDHQTAKGQSLTMGEHRALARAMEEMKA